MSRPGVPLPIAMLVVLACAGVIPIGAGSRPQPAASSIETQTIPGTVVKFELVRVPGGRVNVGGTAVEVEPFLIGRTEVTWDMYDLFAIGRDGKEPGGADATARPSQPYGAPDYNWGHNGFPVISVTRQAAEAFCKWLSGRTGKPYRLLTEAEWARAAALAAGSNSTPASREAMTWHAGNSKGTTHAVAQTTPDALGLFDLFGNATEWVMTSGDEFVTRGGSFRDSLRDTGPEARVLYDLSWQERDPQIPKSKWWLSDGPFVGFRLALSEK